MILLAAPSLTRFNQWGPARFFLRPCHNHYYTRRTTASERGILLRGAPVLGTPGSTSAATDRGIHTGIYRVVATRPSIACRPDIQFQSSISPGYQIYRQCWTPGVCPFRAHSAFRRWATKAMLTEGKAIRRTNKTNSDIPALFRYLRNQHNAPRHRRSCCSGGPCACRLAHDQDVLQQRRSLQQRRGVARIQRQLRGSRQQQAQLQRRMPVSPHPRLPAGVLRLEQPAYTSKMAKIWAAVS